MTILMIVFVLSDLGRWEFSNIEHINSAVFDTRAYCERLAAAASDEHTRAFCVENHGVDA